MPTFFLNIMWISPACRKYLPHFEPWTITKPDSEQKYHCGVLDKSGRNGIATIITCSVRSDWVKASKEPYGLRPFQRKVLQYFFGGWRNASVFPKIIHFIKAFYQSTSTSARICVYGELTDLFEISFLTTM